MRIQHGTVATVVFLANVLAYGFRGLLPATPMTVQSFLHDAVASRSNTAGVPSWMLFGVLESTFVATYALSFLVCTHFSFGGPLRVLSGGLLVWCAGAMVSGYFVSHDHAYRFHLVLGGRLLSGIGDGILQAMTPVIIEREALQKHRQRWVRLYFAGAALGTGMGYVVGNIVTESFGWHWAFYGYSIAMAPLILLCLSCASMRWARRLVKPPAAATAHGTLATIEADKAVSLLRSPVYILTSLGAASTLFTLRALSTYMPVWLRVGGTLSGEQAAAIVYGGIATLASLVAAPLGGCILTWASRRCLTDAAQLRVACRQQFLHVCVGCGSFLAMWKLLDDSTVWSFVTLVVGLVSASGAMNATSVVVLLSVPLEGRSRAMQTFAVVVQVCGDIPAPVLVGWAMDEWTVPTCATPANPGVCVDGVSTTVFWTVLWLWWAVGSTFVTWVLATFAPRVSDDLYVQEADVEIAMAGAGGSLHATALGIAAAEPFQR
ncbi:hypothetical protein H310_09603 [Aphanomyces invadans]|uniref:Major facilitator superfamily (MFS) profile domain-containing protein n=1 Tax=Aphanomyces invadans TaxID=157072 RepID=A0A024TUB1_9STRA|nr:hypothetical protein H310_09603 [Aphanomyces invadans]ETV97221.1 hypothetical protein H310_09603 [Aphanomyces invadans]|eukprot:XP_008873929.1 hypothetical protein H310_09603 [Aphanomyces invadans]